MMQVIARPATRPAGFWRSRRRGTLSFVAAGVFRMPGGDGRGVAVQVMREHAPRFLLPECRRSLERLLLWRKEGFAWHCDHIVPVRARVHTRNRAQAQMHAHAGVSWRWGDGGRECSHALRAVPPTGCPHCQGLDWPASHQQVSRTATSHNFIGP